MPSEASIELAKLRGMQSGRYYIYPVNQNGINVLTGLAPWVKGNFTEVIPVNTIAFEFYITAVSFATGVPDIAANTEFEIDVATGNAPNEVVVGTWDYNIDTNIENQSVEAIFSVPIRVDANTRISARCSSENGNNALAVKIQYKDTS